MKPVTPVIPGADLSETVYAKDQPEYNQLPAWRSANGDVLTRWKFSFIERLYVLFTGNIYVWLSTFNKPLQPILIQVEKPEIQA